jgi:MoaA/NifB/PqqE/SkfB family radical SAM enzyme
MIKTTAINFTNYLNNFNIVWDLGRRCNFDCSYCESSRHNNSSKHKSLVDLKNTYHFIQKYASLYDDHRTEKANLKINFTGGEPTSNPIFFDLVDFIKTESISTKLSLTTNGAWSKNFTENIIKNFEAVTISYHAEAAENVKNKVIENILDLNKHIRTQVNLMLHVDKWDECVDIYELLKKENVSVKLRPIGDGSVTVRGWFKDKDGSLRRTSHEYSVDQQQWFFEKNGISKPVNTSSQGTEMGRTCCGGICLQGKVDNTWKPITLVDTDFKNWHCMVNWFFLYIDEETGDVSHHQTCKALFDKQRGNIGNLSDTNGIFEFVKSNVNNTIICPNLRCGCGMCVPKAKEYDDFVVLRNQGVKGFV